MPIPTSMSIKFGPTLGRAPGMGCGLGTWHRLSTAGVTLVFFVLGIPVRIVELNHLHAAVTIHHIAIQAAVVSVNALFRSFHITLQNFLRLANHANLTIGTSFQP